jgi:hypothetical protein
VLTSPRRESRRAADARRSEGGFVMLRRTRGEDCASDLVLDRWLAGELGPDEVERVERHIVQCARCAARNEAVRASKAALPPELPDAIVAKAKASEHHPHVATVHPLRRWAPQLATALAMAAALVLFVRTREPAPDPIGVGERTKGGPRIAFHVRQGGGIRAGATGDRLSPGDQVQFSYSARDRAYLAIVSLDGGGHASVYYPSDDSDRAAPIEPGVDVTLPQSTVLDETLGPEKVFALFCERAVSLAEVRKQLEVEPAQPPRVEGCTLDAISFVKLRP